ncbi:hypothetical protein [Winogradskya humida]|uniref:Carrier domain-containing protein n=1 Tax=Winogradskya humida TaxID=113566 RepID=A0ABQ3ZX15_9ACTN|nr:hypothetical protein [Actinoplanes humidus]GIE23049.1 hypothetical protein Ahu01nite_061510 [Actinoplanes humidus]
MNDETLGQLLLDCGLRTADTTFDDGTELVLDSLTLVLLAHLLDERHGLIVAIEDEDGLASCTTVGDLRRFITQRSAGEHVLPEVLHGS